MIMMSMMNNQVKYQRTYLSLFVLDALGYLLLFLPHLRPSLVTLNRAITQPAHIPKYSQAKRIRIRIRVLSALTRLMFQMVDAVAAAAVVPCGLPLSVPSCYSSSSFSYVPPPLPVLSEVFSQSPHTATTTRRGKTTTTMPHDSRILEIHVVLIPPPPLLLFFLVLSVPNDGATCEGLRSTVPVSLPTQLTQSQFPSHSQSQAHFQSQSRFHSQTLKHRRQLV